MCNPISLIVVCEDGDPDLKTGYWPTKGNSTYACAKVRSVSQAAVRRTMAKTMASCDIIHFSHYIQSFLHSSVSATMRNVAKLSRT